MPTYDYRCKACGHTFDEFQMMSDPVLRKCPKCGKLKLARLIGGGAGFVFKGSGYYVAAYRSKGYDAAKPAAGRVGIDLGSNELRLVQLEPGPTHPTVAALATQDVADDCRDDFAAFCAKLPDALRRLKTAAGTKATAADIVFPHRLLFATHSRRSTRGPTPRTTSGSRSTSADATPARTSSARPDCGSPATSTSISRPPVLRCRPQRSPSPKPSRPRKSLSPCSARRCVAARSNRSSNRPTR